VVFNIGLSELVILALLAGAFIGSAVIVILVVVHAGSDRDRPD
jgi:hypothetical protein